ncbi:MAG: hypothetical protein NT051_05825 [Candidatus Micrarchaeota archaeon]|nr:hypothetical protein [Candidatus Micrarchaeota archaeon]
MQKQKHQVSGAFLPGSLNFYPPQISLPPGYVPKEFRGKSPGAERAIQMIKSNLAINPGHLTPKMERGNEKFERYLDCHDPQTLCKNILRDLGLDNSNFSFESLLSTPIIAKNWSKCEDKAALRYAMVMQTFQILALSYPPESRRKSGNPSVAHPLRAGAFAAAIGAPIELVIATLLHDVMEDTMDANMPSVAFRTFSMAKGHSMPQIVEMRDPKEIYWHIYESYPDYRKDDLSSRDIGKNIADGAWNLTRPALWPGETKNRAYQRYLNQVYSNIISSFAKGCDAKVNLLELSTITNESERMKMTNRTLLKALWQLPRWKKISWVMFELLLSDISKFAAGGRIERLAKMQRAIPPNEIALFKKGFNFAGDLNFGKELTKNISNSRSPVIDVYYDNKQSSNGRPLVNFSVEFPFVDNVPDAMQLLKSVFGSQILGNPKRVLSKLPYRFWNAVIMNMDSKDGLPAESKFYELRDAYGAYLLENNIIQVEGGFNRESMAKHAEDRYNRLKANPGA